MNKILLIVEGCQEEPEFFEQYKKVKECSNFAIVAFKKNIFDLFKTCKEYIFGDIKPNNIIDILREKINNPSEEEKRILDNRFTDVYLIFDLDVQNYKCANVSV